MRFSKNKYLIFLISVWILTLVPALIFIGLQIRENAIIDRFIETHNLNDLPKSKESAIKVSNLIRKEFLTDETQFAHLNLYNRPFLREDVGFLLTHKEGLCGEGSRVIVDILNRLGFNATRITLYNKNLEPTHTLASVLIGEKEVFIDSINSDEDFNQFLNEFDVSTEHFNVLHYSDNISERRKFSVSAPAADDATSKIKEDSLKEYWLYSYEATPYTKLLTKLGVNVRVFNLARPSNAISKIAERPNTVMAILVAAILVIVTAIAIRLGRSRKLFQ